MGMKSYILGIEGENLACIYLKNLGFEILERNFSSKFGEIDIIAIKNEILHFIEVKTTKGNYEVSYRLDHKKYMKLVKTIKYYFMKHMCDKNYQLDLLCIYKDDIKLIENVSY
ncbi:YraN family protein [Campylobacter insulaenigrae]|uniref:YraN family protein n=1 Tax=Campylobacter insulaenigrae TaxID=260714 RepID=UPI0021528BBD|nr:YraN family protein [Campylobacter insulaenigrae]MCR6594423.1 YraN family protein [Campylobacter insulaenigrae]